MALLTAVIVVVAAVIVAAKVVGDIRDGQSNLVSHGGNAAPATGHEHSFTFDTCYCPLTLGHPSTMFFPTRLRLVRPHDVDISGFATTA